MWVDEHRSQILRTTNEFARQHKIESTHQQFTKTNNSKLTIISSQTVRQALEHVVNLDFGINPKWQIDQSSKGIGIAQDETNHIWNEMSNQQKTLSSFKTNNTEHKNMLYNKTVGDDQQGGRRRYMQHKLDLEE